MDEGNDEIVVVADGFSLAGALPLMMGFRFILKKADYTPHWCEEFVSAHSNGKVVKELKELKQELVSLTR